MDLRQPLRRNAAPSTIPFPPLPLQPVRIGDRSGPFAARLRSPTLPAGKKKASSARDPDFALDMWHGAGGLCDDPLLGHDAGRMLALSAAGWRWWLTGGTTTFLSSSSSSFSLFMHTLSPNRALPNFALRQAPSSVFGSAPCKQPCALASLPSSRTKMS